MPSLAMRTAGRKNSGIYFEPDPDTVLWYPGQEDAYSITIRDWSGNENHGTIDGASWVRLSNGLWCLSFDGIDNYVDCGTSAELFTGTGNLTMELWFSTTNVDSNYRILFWLGKGTTRQAMYFYRDAGAKFGWGTYAVAMTASFASSLISDGVKHHVVGVKSGDDFSIYLDGTFKATDNEASINILAGVCYLGSNEAKNQLLPSVIGLPRIYNRALGALDIKNHYDQERHLFGV